MAENIGEAMSPAPAPDAQCSTGESVQEPSTPQAERELSPPASSAKPDANPSSHQEQTVPLPPPQHRQTPERRPPLSQAELFPRLAALLVNLTVSDPPLPPPEPITSTPAVPPLKVRRLALNTFEVVNASPIARE